MELHVIYTQDDLDRIDREMDDISVSIAAAEGTVGIEAINICGVIRSTILPLLKILAAIPFLPWKDQIKKAIELLEQLCPA